MSKTIILRPPTRSDGLSVFNLVMKCPPLDANSMYCNLLQCTHFAQTSVSAIQDSELIGFISAYRVPERPDTLFVWQVAVGEQARGQGLALRMLNSLLNRNACAEINHLETTITDDNQASWALFNRLAAQNNASLTRSILFDQQQHFNGRHNTEVLVRIGPLKQTKRNFSVV